MISFLIPVGGGNPTRDRAADFVIRRLCLQFPNDEVCVGTNSDEPFNRSKARNDAFRQATGDVLVVCDSDTILPEKQIRLGASMLLAGAPWVCPFTRYQPLDESETEIILKSPPFMEFKEPNRKHANEHRLASRGVQMLLRSDWEKCGGYDERFIGWGGEDRAAKQSYRSVLGEPVSIHGYSLHLWHSRNIYDDNNQPFASKNFELAGELAKALDRSRR